ncbi:hypothetical protein L2E82_11724 [Cichorium intybus]|uniref:Uncharacterized protein n=1 Tax=Cichorium intybus TaxID=13427 RepID=A0ACB9GDZ0_CICIN|nr:hypothetical protein L2E82_11724 [Cichorium intybus]
MISSAYRSTEAQKQVRLETQRRCQNQRNQSRRPSGETKKVGNGAPTGQNSKERLLVPKFRNHHPDDNYVKIHTQHTFSSLSHPQANSPSDTQFS